ncbi:ATP-binding protein [Streptomyces chattanoogensis]
MNGDDPDARALPRTAGDGRPCYLSTDGTGPVSRLANRIEAVQLGLAGRVLGHARGVLAERGPATAAELRVLCGQLTEALHDARLIAESRGIRLAPADDEEPDESPDEPPASALASLPGGESSSARAARRFVRDIVRSWRLPREAADDLESVAGELVANALEHSDSRFVVVEVELARTGRVVRVDVSDEGEGWAIVREGPPAEREYGRGLLIVEAMSGRWGQDMTHDSHTVWAEVAVGGSAGDGAPSHPAGEPGF